MRLSLGSGGVRSPLGFPNIIIYFRNGTPRDAAGPRREGGPPCEAERGAPLPWMTQGAPEAPASHRKKLQVHLRMDFRPTHPAHHVREGRPAHPGSPRWWGRLLLRGRPHPRGQRGRSSARARRQRSVDYAEDSHGLASLRRTPRREEPSGGLYTGKRGHRTHLPVGASYATHTTRSHS